MKLFIRQICNEAFPRYAIECENQTRWSGEKSSPDPQQARRYSTREP